MRRLFTAIIVILLIIVAVGFYRGWFECSSESRDQKTHLVLTIDKDRIREDQDRAMENWQELVDSVRGKTDSGSSKQ